VDIAIQKNKTIAIENLKKLKKGVRGDCKAKLRKILHNWNSKKFLQKLKEEKERELRELIEKESNEYKRNT
jgi:IS605 OrfB family transposase